MRSRWFPACLVVGVLCVASSLVGGPAYGQSRTACGCPDINDLINRLNMAEAALAALQGELPKIETADKQAGRASSMDDVGPSGRSNQDLLRDAINGSMSSVQIMGGQTSTGETGGACGSSIVSSSTKCMDEIVMFHEDNVHVPACIKDRAAGRTTALGFRAPQTTVNYVKEEMAGYQSEITRIREVLRMLPSACRPTGWVGVIYYFEDKTMDVTETTSTSGMFASSHTRQTTSTVKREARILFSEAGTSRGNVYLNDKSTHRDTATGRTSCTGGLKPTPPDRTTTGTVEETTEIHGSGEADVSASFDFNSETGEISLSFEIPGLVAEATLKRSENNTGMCNPADNGSKTMPDAKFSQPYEKSAMTVTAVAARGLDVIRGSKDLDLAPGAALPNGTLSYKARVSWAFYRVDK